MAHFAAFFPEPVDAEASPAGGLALDDILEVSSEASTSISWQESAGLEEEEALVREEEEATIGPILGAAAAGRPPSRLR